MAGTKFVGEEALNRIADYVNNKLTVVTVMPASPNLNDYVLYIGANGTYIQGNQYKFNGTDWELINGDVVISWADYSALPSAIQNNGNRYFVYDKNTPGGGSNIQVDELPSPSVSEEGHIYQYVGTTTADYINGFFYECVETSTPGTYTWVNIPVQPSSGSSDLPLSVVGGKLCITYDE